MIKHKAKEAAKSLAGIQKESAAILAKLTPVLASITALTEGAEFGLVAAPVVEPLLVTKARMECAMAAATDIMSCTDPDDVPECATLKVVMEWITTSKKVISLITHMLAMVARSARG